MRLLLRTLLLCCSALLLSGVGVVGYFLQDQAALIQRGERYFEEEYGLSLSIGSVDIPSWRSFPALNIELGDVSIQHPLDTFSGLSLEHVQTSINVLDFWTAQIQLDQVELQSGSLSIGAEDKLLPHIQDLVEQLDREPKTAADLKVSIKPTFKTSISDLDFIYRDVQRGKLMVLCAERLALSFEDLGQYVPSGKAVVDMWVEQLTFNSTKGSYLAQTRLQMEPAFCVQDDGVSLSDFELRLDDEVFQTAAKLGLTDGGWFYFDLFNAQTPFSSTIAKVPQVLQQKLAPYQISNPLSARIRVRGGFAAGDNPLARIDFHTTNNDFSIDGYPGLDGVSAKGYLLNRASQNSTVWTQEHPLNLRLHFDQFEAQLSTSQLQFQDVNVTFTPEERLRVSGQMSAFGEAKAINGFLEESPWSISEGEYALKTRFAGSVQSEADIAEIFDETELTLRSTTVQNEDRSFELPIRTGRLSLKNDSLLLRDFVIELPNTTEWVGFNGDISDVSSMLEKQYQEGFESIDNLRFHSPHISWTSLASFLPISEEQAGPDWVNTVAEIREYLNPHIELQVDTFQYDKYQLEGVQASFDMVDDTHLMLHQVGGTLAGNNLQFAGQLLLGEDEPICDIHLNADGPASWFNTLFDNNTFFFDRGAYTFSGHYAGPLPDRDALIRQTFGELNMLDAGVLLGPTKVDLPLDKLQVTYDGTSLEVQQLELPITSESPIALSGKVDNFYHLLTSSTSPAALSSSFLLQANLFSFQDLKRVFSSVQEVADGRPAAVQQALKPSLQTLYQKFHPCLSLQVDTFQFDQFFTTANTAQISFVNEEQLAFEHTSFEFKGRPIKLNATVDISDELVTPFELAVETERFDLGALVETYDYFGLTSLQRAEKVAGKVSLNAELQGKFIDSIGLQKDRMLGRIHFNLHEAELVNFAPIQEVANKFFRTERLHTIRFAPITDTLLITHRVVHIPRMEIQSTAFNLFVEGHLNYDNNTNIWVSLPWQNLRSWQEGELPEKTGYAQSGGKLFVEITEADQQMKYRLRLTNKRLYRHRGIPEQYRIDKREERATRRAFRKERRRAKRIGA